MDFSSVKPKVTSHHVALVEVLMVMANYYGNAPITTFKSLWPGCLFWRGWLLGLSGNQVETPWQSTFLKQVFVKAWNCALDHMGLTRQTIG